METWPGKGSPERCEETTDHVPTRCASQEARRGNCVDGCCYHWSTETNCSQPQIPVIIFSLFLFFVFSMLKYTGAENDEWDFLQKRKKERSNMTKYLVGHWGTQDRRLRGEGNAANVCYCRRRARQTKNACQAWGTKFHKTTSKRRSENSNTVKNVSHSSALLCAAGSTTATGLYCLHPLSALTPKLFLWIKWNKVF